MNDFEILIKRGLPQSIKYDTRKKCVVVHAPKYSQAKEMIRAYLKNNRE